MTGPNSPQEPRPFSGRFAGYAAIFGRPDAGGDVIRAGAFAESLAAHEATGLPLPLLWQHRPEQAIGWIEHVAEDARGLRVIARLANPEGANAAMLAAGEVTGLSFGYRAREAREIALPGAGTGRELSAIDVFEISLVANPMQDAARVHLVV
jgi:HK97 family phage prohead protease